MSQQNSIILGAFQQSKKQKDFQKAIQQYEAIIQIQDEQQPISQNKQCIYDFNYQNKKILKIQPYNMYKDQITLLKQNTQKKQQVKKLQRLNSQLKKQYQTCLDNNTKIQQFLKDREFTFQTDNKSSNNQIILKVKRGLLDEAKQTKQKMKKMFKNKQISTIQQLKIYITILQTHEKCIIQKIIAQKQKLTYKYNNQDLSEKQILQFQSNSNKIQTYLTSNIQYIKNRYESYKNQKLVVKKQLKKKQIQQKKQKIRQQQIYLTQLIAQSQGLEYQNKLLSDRLKDQQKQIIEYSELKQKVQFKNNIIVKLEKQYREKSKTYQYMQQWTKQLKKQLEQRKIQHTNKKQQYQQKINVLSQKYQRYNQIFKANLYQQQIAKKKGIKDIQIYNNIKINTNIKPINYQQIKQPLKCMSFVLLLNKIPLQSFIQKILKNQQAKSHYQKQNRSKFKVKSLISMQKNIIKENITYQQLINNLQACQGINLKKQDIQKIARFIIQDGNGKIDQQNGINKSIARQILRKILQRQLQSKDKIIQAKIALQKLLTNYSQSIRHQLKVAGGKEQQINVLILKKIFINYGSQPYIANILTQFIQLYGWTKRKTSGYIKLQDYDDILVKINTSKLNQILNQFI